MLRKLFILSLFLHVVGCDQFYVVHGIVSDCGTTKPIAAASVSVELDQGDEVDRNAGSTDDGGKFSLVLNAPASDLPSTLVVQKGGYHPLTFIARDRENTQHLCLEKNDGAP